MQANDISKVTNPWNGLRTYLEGEVLYGRDSEIQVLSLLVMQNCQTVVYGRSGIGKSSILNAGIFPIVRKHGIFPVYIRLEHNVEVRYIDQIRAAINREVKNSQNGIKIHMKELVAPTTSESLWEFFHRIEYKDDQGYPIKPLVVFDQFEEIFTLESNHSKVAKFFNELTDLLNNVKPEYLTETELCNSIDSSSVGSDDDILGLASLTTNVNAYKPDSDFHIVFTLREDFLSYLERNTTDIPSLKNNRYCLQPINNKQAAEIIMQPRKGLVTAEVAKLIIEKVTSETIVETTYGVPEIMVDSAILSLYLSRLYDKMVSVGDTIISRELVETYSTNIIADFYADAIRGLSNQTVEWMEDTLTNEDGRRDNRDRSTVLRESGMTNAELDKLVNDVKLLRQFSYSGDLRIEFVHDILCPVVLAHKEQRLQQRKLDEEKRKREQIEAEAIAARKRNRGRIYGIVAILFIFGSLWMWKYYNDSMLIIKYYSSYDLINGWPVGNNEELSERQRETEPIFFKLSKHGAAAPNFTDIEICSPSGMLPSRPRIKLFGLGECRSYTDSIADKFAQDLCRVTKLHFSANEEGLIDRMVALDKYGRSIFLLSYFHTQRIPNGVAWVSFITPSGQSKEVTSSGIDRLKLSWDSIGRKSSYIYYDAQHVRAAAEDEHRCQIYGHRFTYADSSVTDIVLDVIGMPLQNTKVNTTITTNHTGIETTEYGNTSNSGDFTPALSFINAWKKVSFGNTNRYYVSLTDTTKFVDQKITRDKYGRPTLLALNEQSTLHIAGKIKYAYDECNNIIRIDKTQLDSNEPWSGDIDTICHSEWAYDNETLTHEVLKTRNGIVFLYDKSVNGNITTIEEENLSAKIAYKKTLTKVSGNTTVTEFFGKNNLKININPGADSIKAHRIEQIKDGESIITKYFEFNGESVVPIAYTCDEYSIASTYPKKKETFDENGNLTSWIVYDNDNNIRKSMMYKYENGSMIERCAMGIEGNPIRSEEWEKDGFGYYKMCPIMNEFNDLIAFVVTNEFYEECAFYDPYSEQALKTNYIKMSFSRVEMPHNLTIKMKQVRPTAPKHCYVYTNDAANNISNQMVAYLHIKSKSSELYKSGLKDGDRIICIDNWKYSASMQGFESAWESLYNHGKHVIKVMRPKDKQSFESIEREVSQLTTSKGYRTERAYSYMLTTAEQQRFNNFLNYSK